MSQEYYRTKCPNCGRIVRTFKPITYPFTCPVCMRQHRQSVNPKAKCRCCGIAIVTPPSRICADCKIDLAHEYPN